MPLNAIEQARSTAQFLQLRAPLLSGELNPIEQVRATAQAIELHTALLDSLPASTPKPYNALELMRFSAELLSVRASLEAGSLNPIEQVRASARGLELRAMLGSPVPVSLPAAPPSDKRAMATGMQTQKNGSVLVTGNSLALSAYVSAYMDQAKFTMTAAGLVFTKSQARAAKSLPVTQNILPTGAVLYTYADPEGVSVAYKGDISGIGRDLANLKSLMAQAWGPVKFRAVFGEDAAGADVEAYQAEQDAIAQRKADNATAAIEAEQAPQRAKDEAEALAKVQADETARIVAENNAADQAEFERTIGAGKADNPLYQAYLDTLEELPTKSSNAGFLGWVGIRAAEFEQLSKGRVSADKAGYVAYVRKWADEHLSERVKAASVPEPLVITAETPDATIEGASDDQLQAKLLAVAKDFYRGLSIPMKDVARRLEKGTYDRADAIKALKQNRDYLIERVKAGAESDADIMARMARQYGDKSVVELESIYEGMGGEISALQNDREMNGGGRRTGAAVANEGARQMGQHRLELGIYLKARQEAEPAPVAEPAPAPQVFTGTGTQQVEPGVFGEPPELGAIPVYGARREFLVLQDGLMVMDESKYAAVVHAYGKSGPAVVRAHAREYNGGRRWILSGEKIVPTEADQDPEAPAVQQEIVEYTTKKGKVLRGIIRTDLSLAEAKAIDAYTWRMNGGYFIREQHLAGDTSTVQAAPAPVVMTPEQQAQATETAERLAEERRQKALGTQVEKLRTVANKAVAGGDAGMNQDRNTNTARRAGMAANSIAKASADKAAGLTLNNIADAIEVGAGGLLTKLSSRAQLEELQSALRLAQYQTDRHLTYSEQQARKGRPFDDDDLRNITLPSQLTWASRFRSAAKAIEQKAPTGNKRLIAALYKMGERTEQFVMNAEDAAITRKAHEVLKAAGDSYELKDPVENIARLDRLARMGITDNATLREAARELLPMMVAKTEESAVKKAERAIIGQKVGIDFFPTPANVAQRMARLAGIREGMRVLEPSAGNGNLADAAKSAGGVVDVIEISSQLRDILTAKGYNVVAHDFDTFTTSEPYQAILMNPPFSQRRDAAHIMRAYGMLAGGGHLVAIAGEGVFFGTDQKAVAFRAWLDTHNATVEKLDGGTFKDKDLLAQTGANARLIILKK